ncbi:MAG: hypothetical protein H0U59_09835 [Gemmatimonadaceae bacterium]|nr:hypothetical protein [Gemmatimonadaceae bacterium]
MPHSRMFSRALCRPVMFVFALAQLLLAFAPLVEARAGKNAQPHVELAGTGVHHAHDDASCFACVARHLLSASRLAEPPRYALNAAVELFARTAVRIDWSSASRTLLPRAPPALS